MTHSNRQERQGTGFGWKAWLSMTGSDISEVMTAQADWLSCVQGLFTPYPTDLLHNVSQRPSLASPCTDSLKPRLEDKEKRGKQLLSKNIQEKIGEVFESRTVGNKHKCTQFFRNCVTTNREQSVQDSAWLPLLGLYVGNLGGLYLCVCVCVCFSPWDWIEGWVSERGGRKWEEVHGRM